MTDRVPVIGVLMCGHLGETLRPVAGGDYDTVYGDLLRAAAPDLEVRAYDAIGGELPARTDECDAWILTGSPRDAFADEPWIVALADFVARAVADRARVAGVCFGHQLVAVALGGRVERSDRFVVGPQDMTMAATPWFDGGPVTLNAMHRDVVTELPPDATVIASGETADVPAYLVGDHVLCVQDHPEFTNEFTRALVAVRREQIGPATADAALAALDQRRTDGPTVGRWITDFLLDRRG